MSSNVSCWVHNNLLFESRKEYKFVTRDQKVIYQAPTEEGTGAGAFASAWESPYLQIRRQTGNPAMFFVPDRHLQTNATEALNRVIRHAFK